MNSPLMKLLFVCSHNQTRSFMAEVIYEGFSGYAVKSAGTEDSARIRLTEEDIQWANMIFVMESVHAQELQRRFGGLLSGKKVICLQIPDIYRCLEPTLIKELKTKLREHVQVPE